MGSSPTMPQIKMPPPPPPPAPMDTPEIAEAELEIVKNYQAQQERSTGSKRKYRKTTRKGGTGKSGKYKGGGLNAP